MSKNVAVFVDVANIFYAAKAAGVDIDYVTLLKSATAGRDFVRAYAYTGLDPENENQRQFHGFLARSGYKVVSKDIRKYGDGRIKANLDIELVVDMMRMARNLDIAVVVSGDGDFAPAIRAVQQMGVRVEVISFRGNTSSDLIEVADVFTDITQIARVDKGTARSGRRVAAEGDLSMTEVPDKETEGAVRRRRGRGGRYEREPAAAAVVAPVAAEAVTGTMPGNLIVLPGERLSRVAGGPDEPGEQEPLQAVDAAGTGVMDDATVGEEGADGRRRRRRRGGRGRGRGRPEGEVPGVASEPGEPDLEVDDEEGAEPEPLRLPQHSTFGSVWDSQLGVPAAPVVTGGPITDDEDPDEPEIPEYLLAERRQRGQGGRGRPVGRMGGGGRDRGRASGYQAAIDRERYGRGGAPSGSSTFGAPRRDDRGGRSGGGDPNRGPRRGRPGARPEQPRPPREERIPTRTTSGGDPWSEVPPELEEMLRAELARKVGGGSPAADGPGTVSTRSQPDPGLDPSVALAAEEELLPVDAEEPATSSGNGETPAPVAPRGRGTRRRATPAAGTQADAAPAGVGEAPSVGVTAEPETAPAPRRTTRRRTTGTSEQPVTPEAATSDVASEAPAAPKRRTPTRRRTADADTPAADAGAAPGAEAATGDDAAAAVTPEPATPRRRSPRKPKESEAEG